MAITATLKGSQVPIKVGWVLRDHYNEILDGGTIVIPQTTKLNIRPYDEVVLSGSPLTAAKTYLVAHYSERQVAFTPVAKYEYSVSLVSKTIKLQRTFLPNISVTQPRTGAGITIAQAIARYVNIYGEKKIQSIGGLGTMVNKWTLSSNITGLTALVPEFTLSKPNLFELFNTMLARENKIIRLRGDDVLDVFDLTVKYNPVDTTKLTYIEKTENAAEYLSETEIEYFNTLSDDADSDAGFDLPIETTIRANDSVLTTENAAIILQKPIYRLLSVKYLHVTSEDQVSGEVAYKEYDITDYVVERTEYETLTTNPLNAGTKKYHRLYYTQGSNQIGGLMYRPYTLLPEAIYQIVSLVTGGNGLVDGLGIAATYGIGRFLFRIKYIPQNDAKMRTSKYTGEPYPAITIDGQKANYGNLELIADEQFKNSQRIGQPTITITASRYTSESQVPALGDYLDEYIVTSREISFNDGFIIFRGTLAKDFVNKTMFTGVTSKRRLYEIASGAESVTRHDLFKLYYEFGTTQKTKPLPSYILPADYALNVIQGTVNQKPVAAIIRTLDETATPGVYTPVTSYAILKETIEQTARNSVLWSFEMQDNYSAGLKQDGAITGGTALRYVSYVNDVGRFDVLQVRFINKEQAATIYQIPEDPLQVFVTWATGSAFMKKTTSDNLVEYIEKFQALPEIPTSDIPALNIIQVQKELWKDNREITKITVQHEFVANDIDIVVGESMTKTNRLYKNTTTTRRFYYSTTSKYNIYENETAVGSYTDNLTFITYTNNGITINTAAFALETGIGFSNLQSWAIATNTGGLILGVNKKTGAASAPSIIYINILENRYI